MRHSRKINTQINMLHERRLGIVYNDKRSPFRELLERDDSVTIHQRNIQILLTKIFLISKRIHMIWGREIAYRGKLLYHVSLVVKTVSDIQSKFCDILPESIRKAEYLYELKNKIKYWTRLNCPSKLCQTYIANVWFRNSIFIHEVPNLPNLKILS